MTDRSDEEVDLHPTEPADIAVLNMAISNADALMSPSSWPLAKEIRS